ncbi:hypothetical protein GCM10025868_22950 [Angustibacter aerolatus]|uniref:Uncharacterized protein n=1 Tax=Angustibacter aerolatus TaxID=1162965 RepID=A0ABQ6JFS9_9ACTN|nr:hypothetical protein GCM10025868_22950 [Angustibacter aerolatus]
MAVLKGEKVAKKKGRARRTLLVLTAITAAGAAGFAVLRRRGPQDDPWAVPPAYDTSAPVGSPVGIPTDTTAAGAAVDTIETGPETAAAPVEAHRRRRQRRARRRGQQHRRPRRPGPDRRLGRGRIDHRDQARPADRPDRRGRALRPR